MKTAVVAITDPGSPIFPLGAVAVASHIAASGHKVAGLIYGGQRMPDLRPYDVVMVGGLSGQYQQVKRVVEAAAGKVTVIGGPIVTASPEVARTIPATYYVSGDGEEPALGILNGASPGMWSGLDGVARPLDEYAPLNFGLFDFGGWLDGLNPYSAFLSLVENPRPYPLHLARGCPYSCSFCWHDGKYRKRGLERVYQELETAVRRWKVNLVFVVDDLLTDIEPICRLMDEFRIKWICQLRPDVGMNLNRMKQGGCVAISYGFESGSPVVLESMHKRVTALSLYHCARTTREFGLGIIGNFIFGDRTETFSTAMETIHFHRQMRWAGVFVGHVMPLPDSELWRYGHVTGRIGDRVKYLSHPLRWVNLTRYGPLRFALLRLLVWLHKLTVPVYSVWYPVMHCPWCRSLVRHAPRPGALGLTIAFCRQCGCKVYSVRLPLYVALRALQRITGL